MSQEKLDNQKMPRQIIVVRTDLKMDAGKMGAQMSHAAKAVFTNRYNKKYYPENSPEGEEVVGIYETSLNLKEKQDKAFDTWVNGRFTTIVCKVKSEEKLFDVFNKAIEKGLVAHMIKDAGFTVFDGPTNTAITIGPAYPEDLIGVTDKLRLLKTESLIFK